MKNSFRFWAYVAILVAIIITLISFAFDEAKGAENRSILTYGTIVTTKNSTAIIVYQHRDINQPTVITHVPVLCVKVSELGAFGYLDAECLGDFYIFVPMKNLVNIEREPR